MSPRPAGCATKMASHRDLLDGCRALVLGFRKKTSPKFDIGPRMVMFPRIWGYGVSKDIVMFPRIWGLSILFWGTPIFGVDMAVEPKIRG